MMNDELSMMKGFSEYLLHLVATVDNILATSGYIRIINCKYFFQYYEMMKKAITME